MGKHSVIIPNDLFEISLILSPIFFSRINETCSNLVKVDDDSP